MPEGDADEDGLCEAVGVAEGCWVGEGVGVAFAITVYVADAVLPPSSVAVTVYSPSATFGTVNDVVNLGAPNPPLTYAFVM